MLYLYGFPEVDSEIPSLSRNPGSTGKIQNGNCRLFSACSSRAVLPMYIYVCIYTVRTSAARRSFELPKRRVLKLQLPPATREER